MNLQTNSNKIHEQNSIIQESKRQKALKEAGGVTFGAAMLAQNSDIVMSQQASQIAEFTTKSVSAINDIALPIDNTNSLQSNINAIKFSDQAYGYSIDSLGFMGEDFNKAAGLPENMKIHKSSLDEILNFNERNYLFKDKNAKAFDNIDMADTIKSYYNQFKQLIGDNDVAVYTQKELATLPKGFSHEMKTDVKQGLNFLPSIDSSKITHIYKDSMSLKEAKELKDSLEKNDVEGFNIRELNFTMEGIAQNGKHGVIFTPNMSVYRRDEGWSKAGVFMSFLKSVRPIANDGGETKLSTNATAHSAFSILDGTNFQINPKARISQLEAAIIAQDEIIVQELLKPRLAKNDSLAKQIFDKVGDKEEQEKLMQKINAIASNAV
ncbi:MAG: hypothetical protein K5978_01170 [Campylobacter sp.]|nr:hypothetical protein [Campylobacter sp.]